MRFILGLILSFITLGGPLTCGPYQHGYSSYGHLKYRPDFKFFNYVNPKAPKGGTLRLAALGSFDSLNPFIIKGTAPGGMQILYSSLLHATLLEPARDEPGTEYGYIAESMSVDDAHTWVIFKLRPQARFSDGTPLTAEDVAYSFENMVHKGHPFFKGYYATVASVEILNPHEIRFNFSKPNQELPGILGQFPIISKKFYTRHGFEKADLVIPVGSGPYRITQMDAASQITYERLDNFWGIDLPVNRGRYNFKIISYRYSKDDAVLFEDFKAGGHDLRLENLSKNWVEGYNFKAVKDGTILKKELIFKTPSFYQGIILNLRRPLFQDIRVRQALTLACDFEFMNRSFFYNRYERLNSYFQNSDLAATNLPQGRELEILKNYGDKIPPKVFTQAFRLPVNDGSGMIRPLLLDARKLLMAAGYVLKNKQLVHEKTGQPFTFEILTFGPQQEKILQAYTANLHHLGIQVVLRQMDVAQYTSRVEKFDFDVIIGLIPQSISPGNEQRDMWQSAQADRIGSKNYGGIKNPVIDDLVDKLIATQTREELIAHTQALDRVLLWNYYSIPLYTKKSMDIAYRKTIGMPAIVPSYILDMDAWWHQENQLSK